MSSATSPRSPASSCSRSTTTRRCATSSARCAGTPPTTGSPRDSDLPTQDPHHYPDAPNNHERQHMKIRKHIAGIAAASAIVIGLAGCSGDRTNSGGGEGSEEGALVGVSMPSQQLERWIADGNNVEAALEELGYQVGLQYANDDTATQISQLENMITSGAKALIIASIDGTTLTSVLEQAAAAEIPVI